MNPLRVSKFFNLRIFDIAAVVRENFIRRQIHTTYLDLPLTFFDGLLLF